MGNGAVLVFFLCLAVAAQALTPSTYVTAADKLRLKEVFSGPFTSISTAHYSVLGLSLLGEKPKNVQEACNYLKQKADVKSLESLYHATSASSLLGNCQLSLPGIKVALEAVVKEDAATQELFYAVLSLKNLGSPVDSVKVSKALSAALKRDDSLPNLGYAFHVASHLAGDLMPFFERIEDAVVQADEVDKRHLQFEGGLGITATIISGIYKLAEAAKKAPTVTADQAVKFTNYFLSRKYVQAVKGAAQLLEVLNIFTQNKYHIPLAITLSGNSALSTANALIKVRVTNVLGAPLGPLTVTSDTATRLEDSIVALSKKAFAPVQGDSSQYSLNFMEVQPMRGFYNISITAIPAKPDSRFIGNIGASIQVKVMTEVLVESVEISTVDRDQAVAGKSIKVDFGRQLGSPLEADYHQKVLMKFVLRDKNAKDVMTVHQAFVQLTHRETRQDVVFVAEPDSNSVYRFDLDLHNKAKEFGYTSGKYEMSLIVGDAVVANSFTWILGDLHLTFPTNPNPTKPHENPYLQKPEIKHLFREQEKRPPPILSNTFSVLVLLPLLLLFILWLKLGANISNFPFSLGAIGFHLGIGAILGLFVVFWLQLNMFTTLKYLALLGVITFLSGHSLLTKLANAKRKA